MDHLLNKIPLNLVFDKVWVLPKKIGEVPEQLNKSIKTVKFEKSGKKKTFPRYCTEE